MILTVTLNPAIDLTLSVDRLRLGHTNRAISAIPIAGGKGINVSRLLSRFKTKTEALTLLGGSTGEQYLELTRSWKFPLIVQSIKESTRVNTVISDGMKNQHTKIDQVGPSLTLKEIHSFRKLFQENLPRFDSVLFAGGLPAGYPISEFRRLIKIAKQIGTPVYVDTRGEALRAAIDEKVFLVKPNLSELEEVRGGQFRSRRALISEAEKILRSGIHHLVVTMGEKGAYWFSRAGIWFSKPPEKSQKPTLAAGDSMMAAILMALGKGAPEAEALRQGTAMACATVLSERTGLATPKQYQEILSETEVGTI